MPIKRMWGGRFEESGSDLVNKFGASITFDQEMAQEDIQGSLAHVKMLKATKILDAAGCYMSMELLFCICMTLFGCFK